MALQATQVIDRATGIIPVYNAVSSSDTFVPGPDVFLDVKNAGASSSTVTVQIAAIPVLSGIAYRAGAANAGTYAVAAGAERLMGPFPASFFADPVTGLCTVTFSFITSVTLAVFSLVNP